LSQPLRERMVLFDFMLDLYGFEKVDEMRDLLANQEEGFNEDGHSNFYYAIKGLSDLSIAPDKLSEYDYNIKEYVDKLNKSRPHNINLKYFQYMAVLFTEWYLDNYFDKEDKLKRKLDKFKNELNEDVSRLDDEYITDFRKDKLRKLAYWMATGSGKTLIMHINLWQFLRYSEDNLDNILLITPNEGLTNQHIFEMRKSGINCEEFSRGSTTLYESDEEKVDVIDIHKLREEEGEKTVSVESFDGNNLVFVDEGHMGASGDVWMEARKKVVEGGFAFEYSATFGQAFSEANYDLIEDYSKSIIMDYSYRHFYEDGYGKDYDILNLPEDESREDVYDMLLGNLLSFYEQKKYYRNNEEIADEFNIKDPLWIFVGSKVNAVYRRGGEKRSDITTILSFISKFIKNEDNWALNKIDNFLEFGAGRKEKSGLDIFEGKFDYLRNLGKDPEQVYLDILDKIFQKRQASALHLSDIKSADGEIGIKIGGSENYFGVINIGDTSTFLNLVEEQLPDIVQDEDEFRETLFREIKEKKSTINLLLGSKKFIQGWDSWRVSNMGLLNVGRGKGPEIIQLFGRGIRLLGKNRSLKRSRALAVETPENLEILETLNIFGIKADYMAKFKEYLEKEGIETDYWKDKIDIKVNETYLGEGLKVPKVKRNKNFKKEEPLVFEPDSSIKPRLNLYPDIERLQSGEKPGMSTEFEERSRKIPEEYLEFLNWNSIYFDILDFLNNKNYHNLVVEKDSLKEVLYGQDNGGNYDLYCPKRRIKVNNFGDLTKIEKLAKMILRKYISKYYKKNKEKWENQYLEYRELDKEDPNFHENYEIKIPSEEESLIEKIKELIDDGEELYQSEDHELPNIYFDRHVYQPLLVKDKSENITTSPVGLNKGEKQFVEDLREYINNISESNELSDYKVYLLRNAERKGVGFFEAGNFYPDFIMWIIKDSTQHIIFIDPHGVVQSAINEGVERNPKIELYKTIKDIQNRIGDESVILDSFILSTTTEHELMGILESQDSEMDREDLKNRHLIFQEKEDCIERMFSLLGYE